MNNIEKKAELIEKELMSQFIIESMGSFDYKPKHNYSESLDIARFQQQYKHYCMQAKSNLVIDRVNRDGSTIIVTILKQTIQNYITDENNHGNKFMKWLYDYDDDEVITHQIKMLTKGLIYKEYESVSEADKHISLDPEQVSTTISLLVYFTLLANDNYTSDDFNQLFVETWFDYYENWHTTEIMFELNGSSWRKQFEGVLLFN